MHKFFLWSLLAVVAFVSCPSDAQVSAETPGYFPFWVPPFDNDASFTDMSFLNPEPAGASGRATIHDGHFYDASGKQLRLMGSNLTFAGAFPPKEHAPKIAAQLRKLGINVVRFHHLDMHTAPRGIWEEDRASFDPEQVDKLDWLIHHLKRNGIYINLNLHVSRTYPGIPDDMPRAFRFGKAVDNFYPDFIQMQKDYARDLLTHQNPYTGMTYAKDPAVIVVELNNENALTDKSITDLRKLQEPFLSTLTTMWRDWLKDNVGTTEALRERWQTADEPLGDEILANGDFSNGTEQWTFEQGGGGKLTTEIVSAEEVPSKQALHVTTVEPGLQSWNLQFHQNNLDLENGAPYTFAFWARADEPCEVNINARLDQDPWRMVGLNLNASFGTKWKRYVYTFKCEDPIPNHCRAGFNFNNRIGEFWFADISLRRGGWIGLPPGQTLEANNIPLPPGNAGPQVVEDFYRFLSDTECAYVREMMDYLRNELGVQAFLCDTQASYGKARGIYREATHSDFIDMHSYWQHPNFPGRPWDGGNWFIPNTSMVTDARGGTLSRLAWFNMVDKPYTVSEYDHPAPNDHAVELFPLLASFAAFQNWDGFYQFNYANGTIDPDDQRLAGYFSMWNHPGKLVFIPVAAVIFRMESVAAGKNRALLELHTNDLIEQDAFGWTYIKDLAPATYHRPVGFRLNPGKGGITVPELTVPDFPIVSNTGEIAWQGEPKNKARYTINAPAVRAAIGYIAGEKIQLGNVTVKVNKAEENWAAIAVAALDGKPLAKSARILVVAAGRVENTNMGWNEDRTSVQNKWGSAPVVAEGIEAEIVLPAGTSASALDGAGKPKQSVVLETVGSETVLKIGPQYETLWYGITP
ncbi:MAG: carbohydrate binding domain-containing protein [Candidatus Hydrogenedentota bacterium]